MRKLLNIKYITQLYLAILLLGTVLPLNSISPSLNDNYILHIRWDYLLHALVYMPLPVLLSLYFRSRSQKKSPHPINHTKLLISIVLVSLFITSLFETLQLVIPYRAFNINDLIANGVGVLLGLILILVFRRSLMRLLHAEF